MRPFYQIVGLCPPIEDRSMGGWGFSIMLDPEFVWDCLQIRWPETEHVLEEMKIIEKRLFAREKSFHFYFHHPQYYVDKKTKKPTAFIAHYSTEGNACGLDIGFWDLQNILDEAPDFGLYSRIGLYPHNIDNQYQVIALLVQFTTWAHYVPSLLPEGKWGLY